jgi:hypothetical protein
MTGDSVLYVYDVDVESVEDGGQVISALAAAALTSAAVIESRGGLWRANSTSPMVQLQGGGASAPQFLIHSTRANNQGAADLLQFQDCTVILVDVNFRQNANTHDVINVTAAAIGTQFQWKGYCFFDLQTGGVGRVISTVNNANVTITDDGHGYVTRCAVGEMFDVGAAVLLARRGSAGEVVAGFIGTAAAIDIVGGAGVGPPGSSRSMRVLATVYCDKTGTVNDDDLTVTVENETTGISSTAACTNNPANGVRDSQAVALSTAILHGPGQPLRVALALTGLGTPTDVRVGVG